MEDLGNRIRSGDVLVVPGVYDALTAALAEKARFEAVFLSGSAVAYSQIGRPDIGLLTMTEMAAALDRIRDRVDIHIFVDADSGYGNAFNVGRTIRAFERAGASVIQIEDQVNTKSIDQVGQRPLVSTGTMVSKLKSSLDSRISEKTLISARTDAMFSEGMELALERAWLYAEAGADIIFVEGLNKAEDRVRLCNQFEDKIPLLYNLIKPNYDDGPTPQELGEEGYSIVLFPGVGIGATANAANQALECLSGHDGASVNQAVTDLIDAEKYIKG